MDQNYPSELAKKLKQCFTEFQYKESKVSELASIQTKLLLQQNPEIPFGNEVSSDTVSQLTKMFCDLGSASFESEKVKLKLNLAKADQHVNTLRGLLQKKCSQVLLSESEKEKILNTIYCYKEELKELQRKSEHKTPLLDHNEQMQNQFCEKLEEENEALEKTIDQLKKYEIFKGITSNAQLERATIEKEILQKQYFEIKSPPATSRLSFSFDESIQ